MKDDQQDDEVEPPIITLEKIPAQEEQNGPNFISDDEEGELKPSQNISLRNELKNLATSYNPEATKDLEGILDRGNLIMELSKIGDAHTISKSKKVIEEESQNFEEAYNHPDKVQREK